MNESPGLIRRIISLMVIYSLLFLVPAFFGVLISYSAQPGGISQYNAFLAPLFGPWSQILPPNSHPVSVWTAKYSLFAQCMTAALVLSIIGSFLIGYRRLRYTATVTSVVVILFWVFTGLMKVLVQLS